MIWDTSNLETRMDVVPNSSYLPSDALCFPTWELTPKKGSARFESLTPGILPGDGGKADHLLQGHWVRDA